MVLSPLQPTVISVTIVVRVYGFNHAFGLNVKIALELSLQLCNMNTGRFGRRWNQQRPTKRSYNEGSTKISKLDERKVTAVIYAAWGMSPSKIHVHKKTDTSWMICSSQELGLHTYGWWFSISSDVFVVAWLIVGSGRFLSLKTILMYATSKEKENKMLKIKSCRCQ